LILSTKYKNKEFDRELQSAVAIAQLKKIDKFNRERKRFVNLIEKTLKDIPAISLAYVLEEAMKTLLIIDIHHSMSFQEIKKTVEGIKKILS
jgi:dTDP-4-amino-4,6-dideoxygalactose transaminase